MLKKILTPSKKSLPKKSSNTPETNVLLYRSLKVVEANARRMAELEGQAKKDADAMAALRLDLAGSRRSPTTTDYD